MNEDTRWVVRAFLDELDKVDLLDTNPPMHVPGPRPHCAGTAALRFRQRCAARQGVVLHASLRRRLRAGLTLAAVLRAVDGHRRSDEGGSMLGRESGVVRGGLGLFLWGMAVLKAPADVAGTGGCGYRVAHGDTGNL